jgi:hypothetical protein
MMRLLTVAVIFALALPAAADAASRKAQRPHHPVRHVQHVRTVPPVAEAAYPFGPWGLQTSGRVPVGDPAHQVYRMNGDYAGADPDPRIRMMLRRDDPNADP